MVTFLSSCSNTEEAAEQLNELTNNERTPNQLIETGKTEELKEAVTKFIVVQSETFQVKITGETLGTIYGSLFFIRHIIMADYLIKSCNVLKKLLYARKLLLSKSL